MRKYNRTLKERGLFYTLRWVIEKYQWDKKPYRHSEDMKVIFSLVTILIYFQNFTFFQIPTIENIKNIFFPNMGIFPLIYFFSKFLLFWVFSDTHGWKQQKKNVSNMGLFSPPNMGILCFKNKINRIFVDFSVRSIIFHLVYIESDYLTRGCATLEIITFNAHSMKYNTILHWNQQISSIYYTEFKCVFDWLLNNLV